MTNSSPHISKRKPGATNRARLLRKTETEAEHYIWSDLRNRRLNGHKFSRQVPLGPYIADFVCRENHLVIELDGTQHADSDLDLMRTKWMNANGYSVLRFWNIEVMQQRRSVLDTIVAALEGRLKSRENNNQFYPSAELQRFSGFAPARSFEP
jgi:very-short-patch-repair endonuclease